MRPLVLLLALAPLCAVAQPATPAAAARPSWFTLGGGLGSGTQDFQGNQIAFGSAAVQVVLPIGTGPLTLQSGVAIADEYRWGTRKQGVMDAHIGLGASGRLGPLHVSAGAGPSLARTALLVRGEDTRRIMAHYRPGAYGSVQVLVPLGSAVGFGIEGYGQTNADVSTAGARLVLAIGTW